MQILLVIKIPFQVEFTQSVFWKGNLPFLFESILHNYLVNDLAAKNAPPAEKLFANPVEFLKNHFSTTSAALHIRPPIFKLCKLLAIFVPIINSSYEIDGLAIFMKKRIRWRWILEGEFV